MSTQDPVSARVACLKICILPCSATVKLASERPRGARCSIGHSVSSEKSTEKFHFAEALAIIECKCMIQMSRLRY